MKALLQKKGTASERCEGNASEKTYMKAKLLNDKVGDKAPKVKKQNKYIF